MNSIDWQEDKLKINSTVNVEGLEQDLVTEINDLKSRDSNSSNNENSNNTNNFLVILNYLFSSDNRSFNVLYDYKSGNVMGFEFTNGKIDHPGEISIQKFGETPKYEKICDLFNYNPSLIRFNRYIEINFNILVGIPSLNNNPYQYIKFYIKNGNSGNYIGVNVSSTTDYSQTDYNTYPDNVYMLMKISVSYVINIPDFQPGIYSLYLTYFEDSKGDGAAPISFGDPEITNNKSTFSTDNKFIFERRLILKK